MLLIAMGGILAVVVLFPNDVDHHIYPLRVLGWILFTRSIFGIARGLGSWDSRSRVAPFVAILLVTCLLCQTVGAIKAGSRTWLFWEDGIPSRFMQEFGRELEGKSMLFLSSSYWPGQPVSSYLGARSILAESLLWDLPSYYPDGFVPKNKTEMPKAGRELLERVLELLNGEEPAVVVIDDRSDKEGFGQDRPFDYLTYFKQDSRFAVAWQRYSQRAQLGSFQVYERD